MDFFEELLAWIQETKPSKEELARQKILLCKRSGKKDIPTDIEVYLHAPASLAPVVRPYVETKPMRTGSGVAVIATMTKPFPCPHGKCTYCPGGPGSVFGDTPQSYTGKEPSALRGARHHYDPYSIVFNRLEQYVVMGQFPDKAEQIVMGGTFPALEQEYQEEYVRLSFQAYNDFSDLFCKERTLDLDRFKEFFELPGKVNDPERARHIKEKLQTLREQGKRTLEEEQLRNETAAIRCVGLTVETRPDYGRIEQGRELLRLGVTRIELGVQTTQDDILAGVHRGHTVQETKESIAELRDLGFKLNVHLMPGLPRPEGKRVSREEDLAVLKEVFEDPAYRPDMLKIYPCMVMPGTVLEQQHKEGVYHPLSAAEAADIIVELKRIVPPWCRIMRIQRDIPTLATIAGVERTNLRQEVQTLARARGVRCRCIRCREPGANFHPTKEPSLRMETYGASQGKELFLSFEDPEKDVILGFLRLRFPPRTLHPTITQESAVVRELHVYGKAVAIGEQDAGRTQHQGLGKRLLAEAERLSKEAGKEKMVVISGVGVREYYRKQGYRQEGPYLVKDL